MFDQPMQCLVLVIAVAALHTKFHFWYPTLLRQYKLDIPKRIGESLFLPACTFDHGFCQKNTL